MPTIYRYNAITADGGERRVGELAGETAAEVRASLRRIGLRVTDIRPARRLALPKLGGNAFAPAWVIGSVERHLRSRRGERKAELLDGIATMLETGVPLTEALKSLSSASGDGDRATRRLAVMLGEAVRGGEPLSAAMASHGSWFDPAECAMVAAGERRGELASVLRSLCDREHRRGELGSKLAAALTYPAIVATVGVGVVVFLSTKTLPDLAGVLSEAGVETPALTRAVMNIGSFLAAWGVLALLVLVVFFAVVLGLWRAQVTAVLARLSPRAVRRAALSEALLGLAELLRTGVPLVEALRVVGPAIRGLGAVPLRDRLARSADLIEGGCCLSETLDDDRWFGDQLRRQTAVAEQIGDLGDVLTRLGQRYERSANRLIDRLARLLEPAVILTLAFMIGLVVMAAILPLLRLQEVVR